MVSDPRETNTLPRHSLRPSATPPHRRQWPDLPAPWSWRYEPSVVLRPGEGSQGREWCYHLSYRIWLIFSKWSEKSDVGLNCTNSIQTCVFPDPQPEAAYGHTSPEWHQTYNGCKYWTALDIWRICSVMFCISFLEMFTLDNLWIFNSETLKVILCKSNKYERLNNFIRMLNFKFSFRKCSKCI